MHPIKARGFNSDPRLEITDTFPVCQTKSTRLLGSGGDGHRVSSICYLSFMILKWRRHGPDAYAPYFTPR